MSSNRASLDKTDSPLDELFGKKDKQLKKDTAPEAKSRKLPGKDDSPTEGENYREKIRAKREKQREQLKEAKKSVMEAREKARKTGGDVKRTTSLQLYGYQYDWLEVARVDSGSSDGRRLSKVEIIRAMIDFFIDYEPDFSGTKDEEELKTRLEQMISQQ